MHDTCFQGDANGNAGGFLSTLHGYLFCKWFPPQCFFTSRHATDRKIWHEEQNRNTCTHSYLFLCIDLRMGNQAILKREYECKQMFLVAKPHHNHTISIFIKNIFLFCVCMKSFKMHWIIILLIDMMILFRIIYSDYAFTHF